jgi:putative membrane protein
VRINLREHLANERTFLAWLRTSIAIIAFGFVIERFGFYLKALGANGAVAGGEVQTVVVGEVLIWLGTLLIVVSLWRFIAEQREIDRPEPVGYQNWTIVILALVLAAVGGYLSFAGLMAR